MLLETGKEKQDLMTWVESNAPGKEMRFYESFWNQMNFLQDVMHQALSMMYSEYHKNLKVIDFHTSKSVKLPVCELKLNDEITIVFRNNFHGWIVRVDSKHEIDLDFTYLFDIHDVYCQEFPEDMRFGSFSENKKQFTFEVYSNYGVYTFMFMIGSKYHG